VHARDGRDGQQPRDVRDGREVAKRWWERSVHPADQDGGPAAQIQTNWVSTVAGIGVEARPGYRFAGAMNPNPERRTRLSALRAVLLLVAVAALLLPAAAPARTELRPDLARHFAAAGTTGTMVIREARGDTIVVGARRSRLPYLPSSTFKIPNALIAIERGVASGAEQAYPGPNPNFLVDGAPLLPAACEGDLTLASALTNSCIPIFQRIARRIGLPAYERAVRALRYGNRRVDGAPLDRFWLEGPFGISAHEQVGFLDRLRRLRLPASKRALRAVGDMLVAERRDGFVLRVKTGYVFTTAPRVGWWVGWVERGRRAWTFALNLDMTRPEHFAARAEVGRAILGEVGALGG
jgi:beta-lactamase class D